MIAQELRPERYTILKEVDMTERRALNLAKATNVIWLKLFLAQVFFLLYLQFSLAEFVYLDVFQ